MTATLLVLGAALIAYVPYSRNTAGGPRGGTAMGLFYGAAGYAMMLFAALLGVRKKVPVWRIGRAQTWMRGHLWLGLLSLPFILFHAGFRATGPLTLVLMLLLFTVVLSGITGAAIQHYTPRFMTRHVALETIYEQIPNVRVQLCREADDLVAQICGVAGPPDRPEATPALQPLDERYEIEIDAADRESFRETYATSVRPFLADPDNKAAQVDRVHLDSVFARMRALVPMPMHGIVDDLESICEEERQLVRQQRIYRWMHGWLLVHVPLSLALLVLGGVHAVLALRY